MNKEKIHQAFIDELKKELIDITEATKASIETATDKEHIAEDKYDTFSLESSYLARGQAQRVELLQNSLERLQQLPLKNLGKGDPIQLGALIKTINKQGQEQYFFFSPSAGGEEINYCKADVMLVTSSSPLGKALLGKREGEETGLRLGPDLQTYTIVSVS